MISLGYGNQVFALRRNSCPVQAIVEASALTNRIAVAIRLLRDIPSTQYLLAYVDATNEFWVEIEIVVLSVGVPDHSLGEVLLSEGTYEIQIYAVDAIDLPIPPVEYLIEMLHIAAD